MLGQPTVMTKFLMLGMPLADVIHASTLGAAETIGWEDTIGTGKKRGLCLVAAMIAWMLWGSRTCNTAAICSRVWKRLSLCNFDTGTLGVGRAADIAVFSLSPTDCMLEDVTGQLRHCT